MKRLLKCLWQDEHGVILSTEIVIVGSVLVVGLITGMANLQQAVNGEMEDLAGAIGSLNQSYSYSAQETDCVKCYACTAGSSYIDREEQCEEDCDDIVADGGVCEQTVVHGVATVGNAACVDDACCSTCGQSSCQGGCSSCASVDFCDQPGPQCVENGVPYMKSVEWNYAVPAAESTLIGPADACLNCEDACQDSAINIPESVW